MMQLSKRLQAVADMAAAGSGPKVECVADVGTDHGYIPIYLVEQGICERAIAMDIKEGPLQRAKEHIGEHQLGAYIQTRLSDGLAALKRDEAQVIVIAGMGGATMRGIQEAGRAVIAPDTVLVLQPQSELMEFRCYLEEHGYRLLAEDMVKEDGKYYPLMKARRVSQRSLKGEGQASCSKSELLYGPLLLQQKNPTLKEFLLWQLGQKKKILARLAQNAAGERRKERMKQLEEEIVCIKQALLVYDAESA